MSIDPRLLEFVQKATEQGASAEDISAALAKGGWEASEIKAGLSAYAGVAHGVAIPKKRSSLLARNFVFYLFQFAVLAWAAYSLTHLIFNLLELMIPLADDRAVEWINRELKMWVANSIIFVPVYLWFAWKAELEKRRDPACLLSNSRQWLTYLAIGLAGLIALGDLAVVFNGLLSGESELRFYLKTLTVFVISGSVLAYYLHDMRDIESKLNEV